MLAEVLFPEAIQAVDESILRFAQATPRPLVLLLQGLSFIGGGWGLLTLVPFFFRKSTRIAVLWLLACEIVVSVTGGWIKHLVGRVRPCDALGWCPSVLGFSPGGFSFPSGHAAGSFAFAAFVGTFRPRFAPWLLGIAVLVAWSRVVLGVHYPSDVTGGAIFGGLAGFATAKLYLRTHPKVAANPIDPPKEGEPAKAEDELDSSEEPQ